MQSYVEFNLRYGSFDKYGARVKTVAPDLVPEGKISTRSRVGGVERIDGTGGWWKFSIETFEGAKWRALVVLDDGQRSERTGTATDRNRAVVDARDAVTDMIVLWAEVRTRVRRCQKAVPPNALVNYRPVPTTASTRPLWRRVLALVFPLVLPKPEIQNADAP